MDDRPASPRRRPGVVTAVAFAAVVAGRQLLARRLARRLARPIPHRVAR